jgi:hypothetical protein
MKRYLLTFGIIVSGIALTFLFSSLMYDNGAPAGYTNSPADGHNCTTCHGGNPLAVNGLITSNIPPAGYTPGSSYIITVTVTGIGNKGFEVSPQSVSGTLLGTLSVTTSDMHLTGNNKYVTHSFSSSANPKIWNFGWTAPAAGTGSVTFYGAFSVNLSDTRLSTMVVNESVVAPSITTGAITGNTLCTGAPVNVPFTKTGSFNTGNIFTAQLSNATGNFTNPVNIGSLTGTSSGTINAVIPQNTAPGTAYRIRVVSSNPVVTGTDNGTDLTINSSPVINVSALPILCNGGSTIVTVSASGGLAPYTGTGDFSATAGPGTWTITDANSCTDDSVLTLTEPTAIQITSQVTDATGAANADGSIDITVTGGTPPYTFNWSDNSTQEDPANLLPGNYSVTITDANNCTFTASVEVQYDISIDDINFSNIRISCYPNPFQDITIINLTLSIPAKVELSVYNIIGEKLETLISEKLPAGDHFIQFDSGNYPSGTYFCQVISGDIRLTGAMTIMNR